MQYNTILTIYTQCLPLEVQDDARGAARDPGALLRPTAPPSSPAAGRDRSAKLATKDKSVFMSVVGYARENTCVDEPNGRAGCRCCCWWWCFSSGSLLYRLPPKIRDRRLKFSPCQDVLLPWCLLFLTPAPLAWVCVLLC